MTDTVLCMIMSFIGDGYALITPNEEVIWG